MLRNVGLIVCCLMVLLIAQFCSNRPSEVPINGGFEVKSPDADNPEGWNTSELSEMSEYVEFIWDGEEAHSGQKSVSIQIKEHPLEQPPTDSIACYERRIAKYDMGETLEISGWIKTQNAKNPAYMEVQYWNNNQLWFSYRLKVPDSKDWTYDKGSFTFDLPKDPGELRIRTAVPLSENNGCKVWFDDIQLKVLDD